jgi:hypothetical protein
VSLNKILSLIILVISFCSISFAQESPKNVSKEKILTMLKELKGKKSNEFLEHMQKVQELTQEFVQRKNEECSGNYSSFLLNEEEREALKNYLIRKRNFVNTCLSILESNMLNFCMRQE